MTSLLVLDKLLIVLILCQNEKKSYSHCIHFLHIDEISLVYLETA